MASKALARSCVNAICSVASRTLPRSRRPSNLEPPIAGGSGGSITGSRTRSTMPGVGSGMLVKPCRWTASSWATIPSAAWWSRQRAVREGVDQPLLHGVRPGQHAGDHVDPGRAERQRDGTRRRALVDAAPADVDAEDRAVVEAGGDPRLAPARHEPHAGVEHEVVDAEDHRGLTFGGRSPVDLTVDLAAVDGSCGRWSGRSPARAGPPRGRWSPGAGRRPRSGPRPRAAS